MDKIQCIAATLLPAEIPSEIVYLPEGEHAITPMVNGKPKRITVHVLRAEGREIAATLQESLEARLASNVRPWLDFDHKGGAAAGLPKRFTYQPGQGVILEVDWTNDGKRAVKGRNFSYFSPTFLIGEDGRPGGLPASGAIGALVNEPAFRDLPRIAASYAGPPLTNQEIRIEAALRIAETELAPHHGGNPDFRMVWDRARDIDAAAFGDWPQVNASIAKVNACDTTARVEAAQAKARKELGEDTDFTLVWARAAEIDPDAFN